MHSARRDIEARRRAALLAALLPIVVASLARANETADPERIHTDAIVVDGHNDVTTWILDFEFDLGMDGADPRKRAAELYWILGWLLPEPRGSELRTHTDLRRLRRGGVDAQFFSIFAHPDYASEPGGANGRAHAMIDALEAQIRRHPDDLALATYADDVRRIAGEGRIAVLMGLEGGHAIEEDLGKLRAFRERGVSYLTLTWSNSHAWADSSDDPRQNGGLTAFGGDVVREMNRLGMLVDVSHCSDQVFWDVIEVTRAPIMASHSALRALVDKPRNLDDEMLRAIARNGGIVMINFGGAFIDPAKAKTSSIALDVLLHAGPSPVPLALLLDHIDHAVAIAGIDHVGLGSDFDGTHAGGNQNRRVARGTAAARASLLRPR